MVERFHLRVVESGQRLDRYISQAHPHLSRSYIQLLIGQGHIRLNGRPVKAGQKLRDGDEVDIVVPPVSFPALVAEDIPVNVVYEDTDLLVVDKPAGLTVHPAPGHPRGTLINALLAHIPDLEGIKGSLRPGIVHRLDKDTSGLMVVAKSSRAQDRLAAQFKDRSLKKRYLVLVHGRVSPVRGAVEAPVGRHPRHRQRMAVVAKGKEARTNYLAVRYYDKYSLLEVSPVSGRTHQIRVHLSAIGHPVVGDKLYGGKSAVVERQFIHASYLAFTHPSNGEWMEFHSDLPEDLKRALQQLAL